MSVLAQKRTVSKAEFVSTANQIYVETLNFLTRLSARYSRLVAEPVAKLALDSRLTDCYLVMMQNPEGCFTTSKGKSVGPKDATEKLDKMAQSLGELIDRENELLKGQIKSTGQRLES